MGRAPWIRLRVDDPAGTAAAVARSADAELDPHGRAVALANATLVFEPADRRRGGPAVEVEQATSPVDGEGPGGPTASTASVAAVGWATVDLERAARELASSPGSGEQATIGRTRDPLLGARVVPIGRPPGALFDVVLLEPDTEGRLAAALARHGEGPAVVYVASASREGQAPAHVAGSRFGPWVVVASPHRLDDRVPSLE